MLLLGKHTIKEISIKDLDRYEYCPVQPGDEWKVDMVRELIEVRENNLDVEDNPDVFRQPSETEEIQDNNETAIDVQDVNELASKDLNEARQELPRTSTGRQRWAPKKLDL